MNTAAPQNFVHRHPFAFSTLVVAAVSLLEILLNLTADLLGLRWSILLIGIVNGTVLSLIGAMAVSRFGGWRQLGLAGRPVRLRALLWLLPFALYGLLPLAAGIELTAGRAAAAVAFGVLNSFWKLAVLGLVLYALLPRGARSAAVLTAVYWGGMHLAAVLAGASLAPTLVLVVAYFFLAFAFVAVRLRTGLLWPLVACYALLLTTASLVPTQASNLVPTVAAVLPLLAVSVLLALYGLVAWPRHRRETEPAAESERAYQPAG